MHRGYKRKLEKTKTQGELAAAAARFPALKRALNSLPPTPKELEAIRSGCPGLPEGFLPPLNSTMKDRWGPRWGRRKDSAL
tara:strand:+ start:855 stop:1097 length:243 start_codon:yes stop_codon:yes gene_type:complete